MKKGIVSLVLLVLALSLFLTGCDLLGEMRTPDVLLAEWFGLVTAQNWDSMYELLSDNNSQKDALKGGTILNVAYEGGSGVMYEIVSVEGDTYTIDVTYPTSGVVQETFVLENSGSMLVPFYTILSFTATGDTYQ